MFMFILINLRQLFMVACEPEHVTLLLVHCI